MKQKHWRALQQAYMVLIFSFLYVPIAVMAVFSFNESKSRSVFTGFTLNWYKSLFTNSMILDALALSVAIALISALISTVVGTMAAVGINKLRSKWYRAVMNTVTDIPMTNPDIITGISLMLMFVFVGRLFGASTSLNFVTLLIAHVTFCTPYVILQVLPKLQQMDKALREAAMDLGCTPMRAFFKAELPEILPGIITGAIMAFTLSLDDFVISYFTSGNGFETLPIRIFGMTKKAVTPKMYALATIIFIVTMSLLLISNLVGSDDQKKQKRVERKQKRRQAQTEKNG